MGLTHLAMHYYQKALLLPAKQLEVGKNTTCCFSANVAFRTVMDVGLFLSPFVFLFFLQGIPGDQVDLRREIAFNLSLIYQASGAVEKARYLLNTHCII